MCRFAFDDAPARAAHRCVPHFSPALLQCNRRFASSIVLGFVVHSAFYEYNQYISPFFGIFSATPHCANHAPKPIAISRQRTDFPVPHPNSNREVRHSLTWHSSKSESALERFEPVAVVQQLPDGRGSVFAPVAARRQKVFKRGTPSSFCPFRSFRTSEKNTKRRVSLSFFAGERCSPLLDKAINYANAQKKSLCPTRFFFCIYRRKRKSYEKENAEIEISRSAEHDHRCRWTPPPFEKGGRKLYDDEIFYFLP